MNRVTLRRAINERLTAWIVRLLVKEHRGYRQRSPNDIEALRAALRPGDVILVMSNGGFDNIHERLLASL